MRINIHASTLVIKSINKLFDIALNFGAQMLDIAIKNQSTVSVAEIRKLFVHVRDLSFLI
jgi:adenylate kinase